MYAVDGQVHMTYMYFPQTDIPSKKESEAVLNWTQVVSRQTQLNPQRSIVTDLIYTWGTLAHPLCSKIRRINRGSEFTFFEPVG